MNSHHPTTAPRHTWLWLVVFLAGVGTLGIEMLMPRLLAPFFGTSQPIWAIIISSTLLYLSLGYWLGGRLADHSPSRLAPLLYRLIAWAGLCCGCLPILSRPVLHTAQQALSQFQGGVFLAALAAVVLLFAAPVILLAAVSPVALRLRLHQQGQGIAVAGQAAGTLSALATLGSLVGTLLPTFVLIPWIGTARTLYLFAALLLLVGLVGLRDWRYLWMPLLVGLLAVATLSGAGQLRATGCSGCELVDETESRYNYIQVVRQSIPTPDEPHAPPDERLHLLLNEGHAFHSTYRLRYRTTGDPLDLLTEGGPWDYFAVAPYVSPTRSPESVRRVALLGAAAGTVPKQLLASYGADLHIDAVEIDPAILALSRQYFDLAAGTSAAPNYTTYAADARAWLATRPAHQTYDLIGVDAYHQPYIPFHLTTVEFFRETLAHLAPAGVVVVNVGRTPGGDERLVNALAGTMRQVFPQVFVLDTRADRAASNALLVGVARPVGDGVAHFAANAERMPLPALALVMQWALHDGRGPVREFTPDQARFAPFTDDRAPVEYVIDQMVLAEARRLSR